MLRRVGVLVVVAALVGCGKAGDSLTITAISPPPGSAIDSSTQFSVTLHYVLQDSDKGHDASAYTISSVWSEFDDGGGAWGSVPVGCLDDGLSGKVTISFPADSLAGFTAPYHLHFVLNVDEYYLLATSETVNYTAP
jgi:hypothetical protein